MGTDANVLSAHASVGERESVSAESESKEEWERERACVWLSMRVSVIVPLF